MGNLRRNKMKKNMHLHWTIMVLALIFGIMACASSTSSTGGSRGILKRLKTNKEPELRRTWTDYTVYKRGREAASFQKGFVAFVYKINNDKKIILDDQWIKVTSDEMKAKAKIKESTLSAEILGQNQELYGYLVYRPGDIVSVRIIDDQTVQLNYRYNRNYSQ
jgi:hypothetical protein